MFSEEDIPADSILVGANSEPISLDRLQAQLHALAVDQSTYTQVDEGFNIILNIKRNFN